MTKKVKAGLPVFLLLTVFFTSQQKADWHGSIDVLDGVTIVKNTKEPLYRENILLLEEELALGGSEAKGEYAFSQIRDIAVDRDEYIYILDEKEAHIKVFDKNGKYLRTIGQKGQGPGDLNNPGRITIYKSDNELMVLNGSQGLSFFSREGRFLRTISTTESKRAFLVESDSQGNILLNLIERTDQKSRRDLLKKFSPGMNLISEIASSPWPSPYDLMAPQSFWAIDEKDYVYYGYPQKYEISVYDPQGKLIRRIIRDYEPVKTTDEERDKYLKQLKDLQLPPDLIANVSIASFRSAFRRFLVDEDGRIFVDNWEKTRDGKGSFFDVFDPKGRYVAKIPLESMPILFKKNKLYAMEEDEGGFQVIKRYKVTWKF